MKNNTIKSILLAGICLLFSFGCAEILRVPALTNTSWKLIEWPGHTIPTSANTNATLTFFTENRISGKSFCNTYGGTSTVKGDSITFGTMYSTKMYCADVADNETKFLNDIARTTTMAIKDKQLILYSNGTPILIFTSQKPPL